jgi:hypothetical protein
MSGEEKQAYDAMIEANKRAKAELSALFDRRSKSAFFDKHQPSEIGDQRSDRLPLWAKVHRFLAHVFGGE